MDWIKHNSHNWSCEVKKYRAWIKKKQKKRNKSFFIWRIIIARSNKALADPLNKPLTDYKLSATLEQAKNSAEGKLLEIIMLEGL